MALARNLLSCRGVGGGSIPRAKRLATEQINKTNSLAFRLPGSYAVTMIMTRKNIVQIAAAVHSARSLLARGSSVPIHSEPHSPGFPCHPDCTGWGSLSDQRAAVQSALVEAEDILWIELAESEIEEVAQRAGAGSRFACALAAIERESRKICNSVPPE